MRAKLTAALLVALFLLAACSGTEGASTTASDAAGSGPGWPVLTPQQLKDQMSKEDVYLVNVHVPDEGNIPGTDASIPYTEIASRLDELPFAKRSVVIYCRSGNMSTEAAQAMIGAGAPPFAELGGGFNAWQEAGFPFEQG